MLLNANRYKIFFFFRVQFSFWIFFNTDAWHLLCAGRIIFNVIQGWRGWTGPESSRCFRRTNKCYRPSVSYPVVVGELYERQVPCKRFLACGRPPGSLSMQLGLWEFLFIFFPPNVSGLKLCLRNFFWFRIFFFSSSWIIVDNAKTLNSNFPGYAASRYTLSDKKHNECLQDLQKKKMLPVPRLRSIDAAVRNSVKVKKWILVRVSCAYIKYWHCWTTFSIFFFC